MSGLNDCCSPCPDVQTVNVPGVQGEPGADGEDGVNGVNAFTTVAANFVIPAIGANVTVAVGNSTWMVIGQKIWISDGTDQGTFEVVSIPGPSSVELEFLGYVDDSSAGATINSGAGVSPSGAQPALAAALPSAVDYSALTAVGAIDNAAIAVGAGIFDMIFPCTLPSGTGAADMVTTLVIGFKFRIVSWSFVTDVVGVGAGASRVFNMEIGGTDVGTVVSTVTLTEAGTTPKGVVTNGTAISGANTGSAADNFSIEVAAGGTAFTAGSGYFVVRIQNMDTADAIASLADHINDLIAAL